ncbi:MobC family plasmid mobilization relaxosome protein [Nocardia rhamnosiphila]|uniref:MobC family plasmid mobilization relaxosome protein n=1 Tax=Nocardia rhamnosiphila TaxID=426716 RepID=UPI0033F99FA9
MAGESSDLRAQARRRRQANVAGGRPHKPRVPMSEDEHRRLTARADELGISVQRLLVETAMAALPDSDAPGPARSASTDPGRAYAALQLLEFDGQLRRIGNNLNQLTRWSHQHEELAEGLGIALSAVVQASLSVDATARWVMGLGPAVQLPDLAGVQPSVVDVDEEAALASEWALSDDAGR